MPATFTSLAKVPVVVPLPTCRVAPAAIVSAPVLFRAPVRISVPAVNVTAPLPVTVFA